MLVKCAGVLVLVIFLFQIGEERQSVKNPQVQEQSDFSVEQQYVQTPIRQPVDVPESVLQILRNDKRYVLACAKAQNLSADQVPGMWFIGSQIHLDGPAEVDLVVQPRLQPDLRPSNRCILGANVGPFWIFRETPQANQLLNTGGHDLTVLDSRTKGYRDIKVIVIALSGISTTIYKFDGQKYERGPTHTEPIR
jgi:hypothetical protein